ncbi:MAG TPA: GNAT family N-acetyltransferase [Anaerolineales bacterium]|nr:GNAT family N-acetyltransferase [Anaerolineales bacterium]
MHKSIFLTSFRTEDLDEQLRAAIIDLCIEAHQEQDFKYLFTYISSGGRHFLAYLDERLVSHAVVTTRWLQPDGQTILKTAYIDAVSTLPGHQGQGFGSAVMQQLAKDIDSEYVIACLETDRESFYRRLGWETWRGPLAGRGDQGVISTPDQRGIMILRLSGTPTLDLDAGLTIECQTGRIW